MVKTCIFRPTKLHRKKCSGRQRGIFDHCYYVKKTTWKSRGFFDQRNYIEKVRGNEVKIRKGLICDV